MKRKHEINSGSMSDIAFLMLVFFMVTTTIQSDVGIFLKLPIKKDLQEPVPISERNVFNVLINGKQEILAENERIKNIELIPSKIKTFVLNYGKDPLLPETPGQAVVSLQTSRNTDYNTYITTLNEIQKAYHEIWADQVGVSSSIFLKNDLSGHPKVKAINEVKNRIPMQISIAEPTNK